MTPFGCTHCGNTVYFENTHCGRCDGLLGFVPGERRIVAFQASEAATDGEQPTPPGWRVLDDHGLDMPAQAQGRPSDGTPPSPRYLQPCDNRTVHQVCNWMLDDGDPGPLCLSCRLTKVIPSLADGNNLAHWAAIERAKRHVIHTLMGLGLTPQPIGADPVARGLCFQLLESLPGGPAVLTGHEDGVITLNIAEADDVHREVTRVAMGEPVRTLLGHLRHEVSHYLAWRHVEGTPAIERCREVFGDDRADYATALQTHYAQGARADWGTRFVSAYASSHPYEDWAETCAHYLLVVDALETASAWGLQLEGPSPTRAADAGDDGEPLAKRVLEHWLPLAQFLNAMNRSLGQADSYPFLLPPEVLDKMSLVQTLLSEAARQASPAQTTGGTPPAGADAPRAASDENGPVRESAPVSSPPPAGAPANDPAPV